MDPLVSIIIPSYNRAHLILETLESIRGQTHSVFEALIIDDGSTDDSKTVITGWIKNHGDRRFTFYSLEHNTGKSSAVNHGFMLVRGDYVMVLDSDDILLPDALLQEISFLKENPECGMVAGRAYILDGLKKTNRILVNLRAQTDIDDLKNYLGDMLLCPNKIISSTVLMRREVISRIGLLTPNLKYIHDWDYWIRVSNHYKIGFINRPLLYYRLGLTGASSLNRMGTFQEIGALLFKNLSDKNKLSVMIAMLRQIRSNAYLAFFDQKFLLGLKIIFRGLILFGKIIFIKN